MCPPSRRRLFRWPLAIVAVFLIQSLWHSPGHNIKAPSMLEVLFSVKEEGRFPSTLALPPGVHLRLWFPFFHLLSYICDSDLSPSFLVLPHLCSPLHTKLSATGQTPSFLLRCPSGLKVEPPSASLGASTGLCPNLFCFPANSSVASSPFL